MMFVPVVETPSPLFIANACIAVKQRDKAKTKHVNFFFINSHLQLHSSTRKQFSLPEHV